MKDNFPNFVKEINMYVQGAQRVPKKMDAKKPTPRHIIIKMPKVKDKERILKVMKEKQLFTYKGTPIKIQLISQKKLCRPEGMARSIQSDESRTYSQDCSTQQSYHLESKER